MSLQWVLESIIYNFFIKKLKLESLDFMQQLLKSTDVTLHFFVRRLRLTCKFCYKIDKLLTFRFRFLLQPHVEYGDVNLKRVRY